MASVAPSEHNRIPGRRHLSGPDVTYARNVAGRWEERRIRASIAAVVADADAAFSPDALWPADEWDGWRTPLPLTSLYVGAAGVLWALDALRRRGHAEPRLDLAAAALRALEAWRAEPDFVAGEQLPSTAEAGLLNGEPGVLAVAWLLTRDAAVAHALGARVRQNLRSEANDVMWGAPGTLLAARLLPGDGWRESAAAVLSARDADGLWTQRLYGDEYRALGPIRGATGNVLALRPHERWPEAARAVADALARTAVVGRDGADWPSVDGGEAARLQWCAGAPGVVAGAWEYLDQALLLAGAERVWRAGPQPDEKGAGLCHGTAGNGWALLKAFARTGDELWLERARAVAAAALDQAERLRAARGRGRYSLWTGDVGVALFAADCLDATTAYPILETWA